MMVMMIHPHDGHHQKAQRIAQEHREEPDERRQVGLARHLQFQHHDGDDDGDDAVAEGFKPTGAHSCALDLQIRALP
jgi:hypothetical protein